jgi:hypothetical protein
MALKRITEGLKRPRAKAGILLLLCLWNLAPLSGLLPPRDTDPAHHGPTEVAAHLIASAGTPAPVCHHHPDGCPADCHCPKIVPAKASPADGASDGAGLREPSLVQCTEGKAKGHHAPFLAAFWHPGTPLAPDWTAADPAWPAGSSALPHAFPDPPGHVPRSASASA